MNVVFVFRLGSLCLAVVVFASAEGEEVNATVGENVILPCKAEDYVPFEVVEWSRPEKHSEHVLVVRNKQVHPKIPEQSYKGRVDLVDMENGDVSLKLRNVRAEDGGTYECYVVRGANRKKRYIQPISTVYLNVFPPSPPPPGNQDGNRGEGGNQDGGNTDGLGVSRSHLALFVPVFAAVSVFVSMAMIAVIRRKRIKTPSPPDDAEKPELI